MSDCAGVVVTVVGVGSGLAGAGAGAGRLVLGLLVVCAEAIVAASAQTMISRRRTAVMQVLLDKPLLRKAAVRVSQVGASATRFGERILLLTNTLGRVER